MKRSAIVAAPAVPASTNILAERPPLQIVMEPIGLPLPQASAVVGCPTFTLRQAIKAGRLKAKVCGRQFIITPDELRRWFDTLVAA
jgi:hypothetical protein